MKKKWHLSIKDIAEMAMLISLAILLDRDGFKIRLGSHGGSLSLTIVPLIVLAYRHGLIKAFIGIGIIYGLLTNLLDGYGFVTYPLDYFLAYGSLSLFALCRPILDKKRKKAAITYGYLVLFVIAVSIPRLFFHILSGMIIYETPFLGSLSYNSVFVVIPSLIASIPALLLLWKPLQIIEKRQTESI